jgi:hypothetical protein
VTPSVLIAANPYEGELCKKALAEIGVPVELADSQAGALASAAARLPLVVIIADGWYDGDARELLVELRAAYAQLPLFLIEDRSSDIADEASAIRRGATRLFLRPIDAQALADAVEKLAVQAELATEVEAQRELSPVTLDAYSEEEWADRPSVKTARPPLDGYAPLPMGGVELPGDAPAALPRVATEVLGGSPRPTLAPLVDAALEGRPTPDALSTLATALGRPPASAALPRVDDGLSSLLRADDALADAAGLRLQALATAPDFFVQVTDVPVAAPRPPTAAPEPLERRPTSTPVAGRSTLARRLDRELSELERKLFPDAAPPIARASDADYADALSDIDLDSLGLDTLPGIALDALDTPAPSARPPSNGQPQAGAAGEPESPLLRLAAERPATAPPPVASAPVVEDEGSLAEIDLAQLLARLHAGGFSGKLRLHHGDGEKSLYLEAGVPVFAVSSFGHDRLGDLLYREGKLTREQLQRTRELAVEPGRRTAAVLVELGLLKSAELYPALRRNVEEIFYSVFSWEDGRYQLSGEPGHAEDRVRPSAHVWALVLEGVRRKYSLERLVELVGSPETVLAPTTALDRAFEHAGLTDTERAVAELFDGERSIADVLLSISGLPDVKLAEPDLYALAWGLLSVGALRSAHAGDAVPLREASTVVTGPPAGTDGERRVATRAHEEQPADRAIDRERLLAKRTQIADCDYFSALGVDRQASTHEIERAYERLRLDFDAERFGPQVRAELQDALDEIHEVLDEAHRVLRDEPMRRAYREHLVD